MRHSGFCGGAFLYISQENVWPGFLSTFGKLGSWLGCSWSGLQPPASVHKTPCLSFWGNRDVRKTVSPLGLTEHPKQTNIPRFSVSLIQTMALFLLIWPNFLILAATKWKLLKEQCRRMEWVLCISICPNAKYCRAVQVQGCCRLVQCSVVQ